MPPCTTAVGIRRCCRGTQAQHDPARDPLLQMKQRVGHGNWLAWVQENFQASERTARNYMEREAHQTATDLETETTRRRARQARGITAPTAPTTPSDWPRPSARALFDLLHERGLRRPSRAPQREPIDESGPRRQGRMPLIWASRLAGGIVARTCCGPEHGLTGIEGDFLGRILATNRESPRPRGGASLLRNTAPVSTLGYQSPPNIALPSSTG